MTHTLLFFIVLFYSCINIMAQQRISSPVLYNKQPFDILKYTFSIDLTEAPKPIAKQAINTITFTWTDNPVEKKFYFHLRDLTIDSVLYNGKSIQFYQEGNIDSADFHYAIDAPIGAMKNDIVSLSIYYHGIMGSEPAEPNSWGGVFGTNRILYTMGVGFHANYVGTTQHWLACYDHPSDKAAFKGSFIVSKGKYVCSNGLLTSIDTLENALRFNWETNIPTATYLLTFAIDSFIPYQFGSKTNIVYGLKSDSSVLQTSYKLLPKMVDMLERYFGPYPFEKVGYVLTPTGSMEHQTMISVDQSIARKKDSVNSVSLHELAHQWFGDMVSPIDFRYAWLTESFATYCETLWAHELKKNTGYISDQQAKLSSYFSSVTREGVLSLDNFERKSPSSNYPSTIYVKGAVVLGMLRHELGDDIFFTGIRSYLDKFTYGNVKTEDFQQVLENKSGKKLDWFFDQWIIRKGWPRFTFDTTSIIENNSKKIKITCKQVQPKEYGYFKNVPIELGFRLADNSYIYKIIYSNDAESISMIDSIPAYRSMTINQGPTLRTLMQMVSITTINESEDFNTNQIYTYPMPAQDAITIEYPLPHNTCIGDIILIDTSGKIIKQLKKEIYSSEGFEKTGLFILHISDIASGNYTLTMKYGNNQLSRQIIITR